MTDNISLDLTLATLALGLPVPGVEQAAAVGDDLVALVAGVVGHALVSRLFPLLSSLTLSWAIHSCRYARSV